MPFSVTTRARSADHSLRARHATGGRQTRPLVSAAGERFFARMRATHHACEALLEERLRGWTRLERSARSSASYFYSCRRAVRSGEKVRRRALERGARALERVLTTETIHQQCLTSMVRRAHPRKKALTGGAHRRPRLAPACRVPGLQAVVC